MNLLLLFPEDFVGDRSRVRLRGRRLQHVLRVHRAAPGDELRVGLVDDRCGRGLVMAVSETGLELEVCLDEPPPAALPLHLVLALPRPKTLKKVLRAVTEMGVKRITLINSWRVEKSYWLSPVLESSAWREQFVLGLEQARDTIVPTLELRRRFKPFVEDELPVLMKSTRALVAHAPAAQPCPRALDGAVTLVVGPEGGFIPYELDLLTALGFESVSLGARSLRVEHAVPALIGRLF